MNLASYDWLLSVRSEDDFHQISAVLKGTSLRFDQNVIVGFHRTLRAWNSEPLGLCDSNFIYKRTDIKEDVGNRRSVYYDRRNICRPNSDYCKSVYERNYYRATGRFKNLTRNKTYKSMGRVFNLFQSGILNFNNSKSFDMTNISRFSLRQKFNKWSRLIHLDKTTGMHVVQYFKVRTNSTLYAHYLGNFIFIQY